MNSASATTTTVQLRALQSSDLPAAIELWNGAEGVSIAEGDSPAELEAYLLRNPGISQAAFAGERLVGAVLAGHDGRRGFLYHLAVAPSHRGSGLGRRLVTQALAPLRAAGIRRVLILVAKDNDAGHAFWSRCGWEDMEFAAPMGFDL